MKIRILLLLSVVVLAGVFYFSLGMAEKQNDQPIDPPWLSGEELAKRQKSELPPDSNFRVTRASAFTRQVQKVPPSQGPGQETCYDVIQEGISKASGGTSYSVYCVVPIEGKISYEPVRLSDVPAFVCDEAQKIDNCILQQALDYIAQSKNENLRYSDIAAITARRGTAEQMQQLAEIVKDRVKDGKPYELMLLNAGLGNIDDVIAMVLGYPPTCKPVQQGPLGVLIERGMIDEAARLVTETRHIEPGKCEFNGFFHYSSPIPEASHVDVAKAYLEKSEPEKALSFMNAISDKNLFVRSKEEIQNGTDGWCAMSLGNNLRKSANSNLQSIYKNCCAAFTAKMKDAYGRYQSLPADTDEKARKEIISDYIVGITVLSGNKCYMDAPSKELEILPDKNISHVMLLLRLMRGEGEQAISEAGTNARDLADIVHGCIDYGDLQCARKAVDAFIPLMNSPDQRIRLGLQYLQLQRRLLTVEGRVKEFDKVLEDFDVPDPEGNPAFHKQHIWQWAYLYEGSSDKQRREKFYAAARKLNSGYSGKFNPLHPVVLAMVKEGRAGDLRKLLQDNRDANYVLGVALGEVRASGNKKAFAAIWPVQLENCLTTTFSGGGYAVELGKENLALQCLLPQISDGLYESRMN